MSINKTLSTFSLKRFDYFLSVFGGVIIFIAQSDMIKKLKHWMPTIVLSNRVDQNLQTIFLLN